MKVNLTNICCSLILNVSLFSDKPHNPLVNAGSIVVNALLYSLVKPEMSSSEKFDYIQNYFRVIIFGYLIFRKIETIRFRI